MSSSFSLAQCFSLTTIKMCIRLPLKTDECLESKLVFVLSMPLKSCGMITTSVPVACVLATLNQDARSWPIRPQCLKKNSAFNRLTSSTRRESRSFTPVAKVRWFIRWQKFRWIRWQKSALQSLSSTNEQRFPASAAVSTPLKTLRIDATLQDSAVTRQWVPPIVNHFLPHIALCSD